jgi:hypothetical protein
MHQIDDEQKHKLKQQIIHHGRNYFLYALFISLFLFAFTTYRRLILGEYHISYLHYGICVIQALILSKVILIGEGLSLGNKYADKPLIIPTIYKTLAFTFLVILLSILEHFIAGAIKHQSMHAIFNEFKQIGVDEILARILIMVFFFGLFFAFLELGRVLGPGKLYELFIKKRK